MGRGRELEDGLRLNSHSSQIVQCGFVSQLQEFRDPEGHFPLLLDPVADGSRVTVQQLRDLVER